MTTRPQYPTQDVAYVKIVPDSGDNLLIVGDVMLPDALIMTMQRRPDLPDPFGLVAVGEPTRWATPPRSIRCLDRRHRTDSTTASVSPPGARRSPSAALTAAIDSVGSSITRHPDRGWVTVYSGRAVRQARARCPGTITPSSAQSSSTARRNSGPDRPTAAASLARKSRAPSRRRTRPAPAAFRYPDRHRHRSGAHRPGPVQEHPVPLLDPRNGATTPQITATIG